MSDLRFYNRYKSMAEVMEIRALLGNLFLEYLEVFDVFLLTLFIFLFVYYLVFY